MGVTNDPLVVVKPDTLLSWHREGFRLYWKRRSRGKKGRPPTSAEVIALIEEIAINNRTWRAERIKGELLKLGIEVHADTVKKYMRRARKGVPGTYAQARTRQPHAPRAQGGAATQSWSNVGNVYQESCWRDVGMRFLADL